MSKPFFEVFPTLKLNDDLWLLFEAAKVTKVVTNSNRDYIRVHLKSRHLIQKEHIYQVEQGRSLNTPILFAGTFICILPVITLFTVFSDKFLNLSYGSGIKG